MEISPGYRKILSGEARGPGAACLRCLLYGVSLLYGLVARARNFLYNNGVLPEHRVDKPVLCVGNITTGGTGKTPAVEYVVRWFAEREARPAIISRGYGARGGENDEALLLAAHLPGVPHRQNADRFRAAVEAMRLDDANVLVLDDGFQHRRLARFGNVVLIDATCPFGYGHFLPRGLLREPVSGLRRADVIVVTRSDLVDEGARTALTDRLRRVAPDVPVATSRHAPTAVTAFPDGDAREPSILAGKRLGLFCSIGNPGAFRRTVEDLGAAVEWACEFSDHHWYTPDDVARITRADNHAVDAFVTTEKDAVKLVGLRTGARAPVWPKERKLLVLRVEMEMVSGEEGLARLFEEALRASKYGEE